MDGDTLTALMDMNSDRSVWGVETDDFKTAYFDYLNGLKGDDTDRDSLISRLMWCVDVWDKHRLKYFPDVRCDRSLQFPFFEAPGQAGANEEPAKYKLVGSAGQPSVIAIRHNLLMGTSDLTIWKSDDGERRLVLKKDHPKRDAYIERLIVHELLHQFLVEAAPEFIRREYTQQTTSGAASNGGEFKTYKGHGNLFARFADQLSDNNGMPLLGNAFEAVPLRHYKVRNAAAADRHRPSCSWFCTLDMFFAWDPAADGLSDEQLLENDARMKQALAFYGADARGEGGAVALVKTEAPLVETFEAPFDTSCADACIHELGAFDKANGTDLVGAFVRRITEGFSVPFGEPAEIPTSARAVTPGCPFNVNDKVRHQSKGDLVVTHLFQPVDGSHWNLGVLNRDGVREIVSAGDLIDDIGLVDVPMDGDKPKLKALYPLERPSSSLKSLEFDIEIAKEKGVTKSEFAQQRFGLPNGQQLSRHLKALRQAAA